MDVRNLPEDAIEVIKQFVFDSRIEDYSKLYQWSWRQIHATKNALIFIDNSVITKHHFAGTVRSVRKIPGGLCVAMSQSISTENYITIAKVERISLNH